MIRKIPRSIHFGPSTKLLWLRCSNVSLNQHAEMEYATLEKTQHLVPKIVLRDARTRMEVLIIICRVLFVMVVVALVMLAALTMAIVLKQFLLVAVQIVNYTRIIARTEVQIKKVLGNITTAQLAA